MKTLLTGRPGVGKTTVVAKVAENLRPRIPVAGFLTREIREQGRRTGFRIETLDGAQAVLAHVNIEKGPRVGQYRVDVEAFEETAVRALENAEVEEAVWIVDEIGKMELHSEKFAKRMDEWMASAVTLLATVMPHPHPQVDAWKRRPDVRLIEVTYDNRDSLVRELSLAYLPLA